MAINKTSALSECVRKDGWKTRYNKPTAERKHWWLAVQQLKIKNAEERSLQHKQLRLHVTKAYTSIKSPTHTHSPCCQVCEDDVSQRRIAVEYLSTGERLRYLNTERHVYMRLNSTKQQI